MKLKFPKSKKLKVETRFYGNYCKIEIIFDLVFPNKSDLWERRNNKPQKKYCKISI